MGLTIASYQSRPVHPAAGQIHANAFHWIICRPHARRIGQMKGDIPHQHGFLNNVKHTGNTIQQLKLWGGQEYTNEAGYEEKQAVSDQNIVTANGTGQLEFCRELLLLLKADTPENIHASYDFYKNGFVR